MGARKLITFSAYYALYIVFLALCVTTIIVEYTGVIDLGKADIVIPSYQVGFTIGVYKVRQNILKLLLEKLNKFWNLKHFDEAFQDEIQAIKKNVIYYVYAYKLVIIIGISFTYLKPFTSMGKEFPMPWYSLCDATDLICYGMSVLIQYYCITILIISIFTFDGIFTSLVFDVTVQLKMIKWKLRALDTNGVTSINAYKELTSIIQHHSFILGYIGHLNEFYAPILLSQFSACTFSLSMGLFLLTLEGAPSLETLLRFLSYLMALSGQVFVYSFGGQMLSDVSESIADTAYFMEWWRGSITFQKLVLLLILRAQIPSFLSIGAITEANMRMYLYASKTAFSVYTVMNRMYDN